MHRQRLLIVIFSIIGLISIFLPWRDGSVYIYGLNSYNLGIVILPLYVIVATLSFLMGKKETALSPNGKKITGFAGAAIASLMIYEWFLNGLLFSGIGIYVGILAGFIIMAVPFVIKADGGFEMPTQESIEKQIKNSDEKPKE